MVANEYIEVKGICYCPISSLEIFENCSATFELDNGKFWIFVTPSRLLALHFDPRLSSLQCLVLFLRREKHYSFFSQMPGTLAPRMLRVWQCLFYCTIDLQDCTHVLLTPQVASVNKGITCWLTNVFAVSGIITICRFTRRWTSVDVGNHSSQSGGVNVSRDYANSAVLQCRASQRLCDALRALDWLGPLVASSGVHRKVK